MNSTSEELVKPVATNVDEKITVVWEQVLDGDTEEALLHAFEMIFLDQPMNPSTRQLDAMTLRTDKGSNNNALTQCKAIHKNICAR